MNNVPIVPPQASEHAWHYDALFWTITGLTAFFTILVGIVILVLATKYKRGSSADRRNPIDHSTLLELGWTIPPLFLALAIFGWSTKNYLTVRTMPEDALDVFVIGKQWMWHVQHMDGTRENNELHIPVGRPVKLTMISQDVIHAMYLPDFRAQYHVVPGRYTQLAFTPTKPGYYKMLCAMHCGTQHSEMVGYVYVLSEKDYAEWVEKGGNRYKPKAATVVDHGKQVWEEKRCYTCHTEQNTNRGPSLLGINGRKRVFDNGSSTIANDDYLRLSILEPSDQLVAGYDPTMQSYKGQLTEEDVMALIAYMKSLGGSSAEAGGKTKYVRPDAPTAPDYSANQSAADIANKKKSAGATQAEESRNRP